MKDFANILVSFWYFDLKQDMVYANRLNKGLCPETTLKTATACVNESNQRASIKLTRTCLCHLKPKAFEMKVVSASQFSPNYNIIMISFYSNLRTCCSFDASQCF